MRSDNRLICNANHVHTTLHEGFGIFVVNFASSVGLQV